MDEPAARPDTLLRAMTAAHAPQTPTIPVRPTMISMRGKVTARTVRRGGGGRVASDQKAGMRCVHLEARMYYIVIPRA